MFLPRGGNKSIEAFYDMESFLGMCVIKKNRDGKFQGLSDRCFQEGAQVTSVLYAYIDFCVGFTNTTTQKKKRNLFPYG